MIISNLIFNSSLRNDMKSEINNEKKKEKYMLYITIPSKTFIAFCVIRVPQ